MTDILFQGDPAIQILDDGATLIFTGGNPIMDPGLENQAQISLLTEPGWAGNFLFSEDEQKIGSDFEETARGPITLSRLSLIEKSAESALTADLFGNVRAIASNPESWRTDVEILIEPPGSDIDTILLTRNGINWINQAANPAHKTAARHSSDDQDPCIPTSFLALSGTDAPIVGSIYSASGGCEPYSYSISCGAISSTGEITDLTGCCGAGTATVTDSTGASDQIVIRFPDGIWVFKEQLVGDCGGGKNTACDATHNECIVGDTRYNTQWFFTFNDPGGDSGLGGLPPCDPCVHIPSGTVMCPALVSISKWECP